MNFENASVFDKEELRRLLITQFFEDSIFRYGPDSEQARALSKFLVPNNYDSQQESFERALPAHLPKVAGCRL